MDGEKLSRFKQNTIALVYDFDGTLSPEAMQHYGVLPSLDVAPGEFWKTVKQERTATSSEELLVYMRDMLELAKAKHVRLDRPTFHAHGSSIKFFPGVLDWFGRINSFAGSLPGGENVNIEHYVISSGLKEMIEGSAIAHEFKEIFACEFYYSEYGAPEWPARVISDTSKTQYLFRINKGVLDVNESINSHMPEADRRVPFDNIIYIGDGDTDVPSMTVTMKSGGHAVAVYSSETSEDKCKSLKEAGRIDFYCEADYTEGSTLDDLIKSTLRVLVARVALRQKIFHHH